MYGTFRREGLPLVRHRDVDRVVVFILKLLSDVAVAFDRAALGFEGLASALPSTSESASQSAAMRTPLRALISLM